MAEESGFMKGVSAVCTLFQIVLGAVLILGVILSQREVGKLRENAMDLCAWNARDLVKSDEEWRDVRRGDRVCPFCGQSHGPAWKSYNGWDSQLNAMLLKDKQ